MGPLTYAVLAIQGLFWALDAAAHLTHYRYGETASAAIWWLERRFPIMHIVIGLALAVLFTHLEFQIP